MKPLSQFVQNFGRGFVEMADQAKTFWDHVADGMALNQLWEEFKADTQAGYKFYAKDVDWVCSNNISA